uniref:G-protein coupled receptors family 1 profile domain-containing protein n=1 Tax=Malurus cyaneus samueli TaxID=2593467 RepID=A0A8C5TCE6_9PASS
QDQTGTRRPARAPKASSCSCRPPRNIHHPAALQLLRQSSAPAVGRQGMGLGPHGLRVRSSGAIILENLHGAAGRLRCLRARRWVYSLHRSYHVSDCWPGVAYLSNLCLSGSRTFQLSPQLLVPARGNPSSSPWPPPLQPAGDGLIERYSAMVRPHREERGPAKTLRLRCSSLSCWLLRLLVIGLLRCWAGTAFCDFQACSVLLPLYSKDYILFLRGLFSIILLGIHRPLHLSSSTWCRPAPALAALGTGRSAALRLLKTVLMILGAFIICGAPSSSCCSWICSATPAPAPTARLDWTAGPGACLNSGVNPVIYSLRSVEVRRAVGSLLACCCLRLGLSPVSGQLPWSSRTSTRASSTRCTDSLFCN